MHIYPQQLFSHQVLSSLWAGTVFLLCLTHGQNAVRVCWIEAVRDRWRWVDGTCQPAQAHSSLPQWNWPVQRRQKELEVWECIFVFICMAQSLRDPSMCRGGENRVGSSSALHNVICLPSFPFVPYPPSPHVWGKREGLSSFSIHSSLSVLYDCIFHLRVVLEVALNSTDYGCYP